MILLWVIIYDVYSHKKDVFILKAYIGSGTVICCSFYIRYKWSYWERRNIPGPPPSISNIGHTAKAGFQIVFWKSATQTSILKLLLDIWYTGRW